MDCCRHRNHMFYGSPSQGVLLSVWLNRIDSYAVRIHWERQKKKRARSCQNSLRHACNSRIFFITYLPTLDVIMITLRIQQHSLSELFCYFILSFRFLFCFYLMRQMEFHFVPFLTVWTESCIQEILTHHSLLMFWFLFYLTTLSLIYLFWTDLRSSRMLPNLDC
jgi:hypothetical protein